MFCVILHFKTPETGCDRSKLKITTWLGLFFYVTIWGNLIWWNHSKCLRNSDSYKIFNHYSILCDSIWEPPGLILYIWDWSLLLQTTTDQTTSRRGRWRPGNNIGSRSPLEPTAKRSTAFIIILHFYIYLLQQRLDHQLRHEKKNPNHKAWFLIAITTCRWCFKVNPRLPVSSLLEAAEAAASVSDFKTPFTRRDLSKTKTWC